MLEDAYVELWSVRYIFKGENLMKDRRYIRIAEGRHVTIMRFTEVGDPRQCHVYHVTVASMRRLVKLIDGLEVLLAKYTEDGFSVLFSYDE